MQRFSVLALVVCLAFSSGCATRTHVVDSTENPLAAAEIAPHLRFRKAQVLLKSGEVCQAREVRAQGDNFFWVDAESSRSVVVPLAAIETLTVKRRGLAALGGAGVGLLSGFGIGAVVDLATTDTSDWIVPVGPGMLSGASLGLMIGGAVGAGKGMPIEWRVQSRQGNPEIAAITCDGLPQSARKALAQP